MIQKIFYTLILTITSLACANTIQTTPVQATSSSSSQPAQLLKADANFYRVDEKLYRSEQLIAEDRAAIEAENIRSIVNLRFFDRNNDKTIFTNPQIELINTPLLTWHIRPKHIAQVLWVIEQQQQKGAVLVHCYHGANRTGIIIAMYRMVQQGWSIADAKHEMQQGGFGYHSIWRNLDRLFTEQTVQQVRAELQRLRVQAAK